MKNNIHKKITGEDKFARKYYSQHARLSLIRQEKKQQKKKLRYYFKNCLKDNYKF